LKKILVIQHKMIGDVLISSIICDNLRKVYPDAQIDYLVNDNTLPVLENNLSISNTIVFGKKEQKSFLKLLKFAYKIRKQKYDILIDAYSKLQSWTITLISGAKVKISYKKPGRTWLYNHNIPYAKQPASYLGLAIERRLSLLEPIGINDSLITFPTLYVTTEEQKWANKLFENYKIPRDRKTIMLSIIGSEKRKTYPLEYMSQLISFIADNFDVNFLFNYFPKQIEDAKKIYENCSEKAKTSIYFDVFGNSIREYLAIMDNCDMIIGNDGGAINMAKALDKPSFIIFSPWIEKKIWATFEDGKKHTSVHLQDFEAQLFVDKTESELKENAIQLYWEFLPDYIKPKLKDFLSLNI
jgi:ADP-heptose:LPS heptosyltransferase